MVADSRMPSAVQNTSLSVSNLQKQSSLLLLNGFHLRRNDTTRHPRAWSEDPHFVLLLFKRTFAAKFTERSPSHNAYKQRKYPYVKPIDPCKKCCSDKNKSNYYTQWATYFFYFYNIHFMAP